MTASEPADLLADFEGGAWSIRRNFRIAIMFA